MHFRLPPQVTVSIARILVSYIIKISSFVLCTIVGFFVSQFSIFLYLAQAIVMSVVVLYQNSSSIKDVTQVPHSIYVNMAGLDAASGTLSAIGMLYTMLLIGCFCSLLPHTPCLLVQLGPSVLESCRLSLIR